MSRERQTFIKHFHGHLLTTRSIENWKERIENDTQSLRITFFIKDKFLKFFLFLYFFNNLASNIISFLLKKTLFFRLSSREPFMESSNNCTCSM